MTELWWTDWIGLYNPDSKQEDVEEGLHKVMDVRSRKALYKYFHGYAIVTRRDLENIDYRRLATIRNCGLVTCLTIGRQLEENFGIPFKDRETVLFMYR